MSVPEASQRPWAAPEFKVGQRVRRRVFRLDAATEGTVVRFNWRGWPVVRWDGTQEPHTIHPVVLGEWQEAVELLERLRGAAQEASRPVRWESTGKHEPEARAGGGRTSATLGSEGHQGGQGRLTLRPFGRGPVQRQARVEERGWKGREEGGRRGAGRAGEERRGAGSPEGRVEFQREPEGVQRGLEVPDQQANLGSFGRGELEGVKPGVGRGVPSLKPTPQNPASTPENPGQKTLSVEVFRWRGLTSRW